ncbi:polysaccharide deacetylase family protein [Nostoc sp. 106C]|uniref:polysaccharide deacetylase family protein n=1 Tax=Nostoc sp. 106C TaxID=1932667 RepID=UPI000A37785C|nr:polysaccharide deacetylase family protein [Nostoc sp. 106C]OUL22474.1 polysaccharide deacetylase [Nostoc sp. RF31YmG]OUL26314.1 polysaccharide deacetylase [Nostoc sp. 106C]
MENNKSFFWPQGLLIALVALVGSFSLGLMMLVKPNASEAQSQQTINETATSAKVGTQERIESLKATMLTTWQQQAKAKGFAYAIPPSFLGVTIEAAKISPGKKVIALTFDDGPWPESTAKVLDILKQNDIKATFFVVGQNVKNFPELLKRVVAEGHTVANHTWHHWYHFMNPQTAAYEIDHTTDLIFQTTGVKTNLFRPPGGIMHNGVAAYAKNSKYAIIMWSSDSMDYSRPSVPRLINNVFREAKPGGIVLMHDGGGNRSQTVEALPTIIADFRKQGYSFVTVPELLEMQDKDQKLIANKK